MEVNATKVRKDVPQLYDTYVVTYTRHHNPLLITNRSQILTIHKGRIFEKTSLKNVFDLQEVGKNYTNRGL